ncbi:uncharacterized protein LOC143447389 isoform X2 [Clavelina lepadiformis]|uniref:uncharacterized protein LOC143447389 isoform X2 n=1 Tax=Clavelina lepadiformis TaxID=159417 RepID=UPI0040422F9B
MLMTINNDTIAAERRNNVTILFTGSSANSHQTTSTFARNKAICRFVCAGLFMIPAITLLTVGGLQASKSDGVAYIAFGACFAVAATIALVQSCIEFRKIRLNDAEERSGSDRSDGQGTEYWTVAYRNYPLPEVAQESALPSYESATKDNAPPSYEETIRDENEPP